jgi:hypothetical protein
MTDDDPPVSPLDLAAEWVPPEPGSGINWGVDGFPPRNILELCDHYLRDPYVQWVEEGRYERLAPFVPGPDTENARDKVLTYLAAVDPECGLDSLAMRTMTARKAALRIAVLQLKAAQPGAPPRQADLVPPQQAAVLLALLENHPVRMTVEGLAGRLRPGEKSIRGYLRALRARGLVAPPVEKGGFGLTPEGLALAKALPPDDPAVKRLLRPV